MEADPTNTTWSKPTRYIVAVSLVLAGIWLLYLARSVIPLLVIAALVAVIVRPIIQWLHLRARLPRGLAVALVYLAVAILAPIAVMLAIPALVDAVRYVLSIDYQNVINSTTDWLRSLLVSIKAFPLPPGGLDTYIDQIADALLIELGTEGVTAPSEPPSVAAIVQSLGTALTATFRTAAGVAGEVVSRVALVLFMLLASIYISLSVHTFYGSFMRGVPEPYRPEIAVLLGRLSRMWGAFFRGQLTLMFLIGAISWLGLTALGMPGALYLGIIAGLLELIPNLGPIIATIPAVIVALLQGSSFLPVSNVVFALIIILFYILVQQVENNVVVPRVLGGAVNLPPLVVMTGVLVGAEVGGLLGALLATPVIATARELAAYAYRKILQQDPFPPEEEAAVQPPAAHGARVREWVVRLARSFRPRPPLVKNFPAPEDEEPGPPTA